MGHLIYGTLNSAVSLFCWDENHDFLLLYPEQIVKFFYFIPVQPKLVAVGLVTVHAFLTLSSSFLAKSLEPNLSLQYENLFAIIY